MEEQEKTLQDYLAMLSRRKVPMLITMTAVFCIGVVIALVWPPTYRSTATILIKEQEVPVELVRSTVTSYATQRIQTISQRVMTRTNLMQIIEKYGLYKKELKLKTTEEVLDEMREDIGLNMIDADVVDPISGRPTTATIAFNLSFVSEHPDSAQKVAGELTSLFLAENLKTRKEKASETYVFLTDETEKLSKQILELETKLAAYKAEYADSLPEVASMNMSILDRTERDLVMVDTELRSKEERKFYLESELAQINPLTNMRSATGQAILDPVSRLKALESEYAGLTAKYSEEHPDVIKIKREIDGLRTQVGSTETGVEKAKKLTSLRSELGVLKKKYANDHPDVMHLEKTISTLEKEVDAASKSPEHKLMSMQPDNPAYISIQSQMKAVTGDIESLKQRKQELKIKLEDYENRIAMAPQVEKGYQVLKREHENALLRYRDIKARQMEADIGQQLEEESKGESFLLIDPAQLPEEPIKPNRIAIMFLAMIFSMACGFGYVLVAEALDSSVRGINGINKLLTSPPLAVIPVIFNTQDLLRKKRASRILLGSVVGSVILVVLLVHFFWTPLDVLWFRGLRKAETVIGI